VLLVTLLWANPGSEPRKHLGRSVPPQGAVRVPERSLDDLFSSTHTPLPIPDPGTVVDSIVIGQSLTIQDMDVGVTITHSWVRDLRLSLERDTMYVDTFITDIDSVFNEVDSTWVHTDTTWLYDTVYAVNSVVLLDLFPGDDIVNMTNTWFDQDAGQSIWDGSPPFTGSYQPIDSVNSLDRFNGTDALGVWRLRVLDRFIGDVGVLESFQIEINGIVNLQGTVTNTANSSPVASATVTVINSASSDTVARGTTGAQGTYGFQRILPNSYRLLFAAAGFDSLTVDNVIVSEGQATTQDAQLIPQVDFVNVSTRIDSISIVDEGRIDVPLTVSVANTIRDLDVTINCASTWIGEMLFSLQHPNGDTITLFMTDDPLQDIGDDMTNCRFDDEAAQSFEAGEGPFTGSYRPLDSLARFDNRASDGIWTIHATDRATGDTAKFAGYTLHFQFPQVSADDPAGIPTEFSLLPAYPNPFNASVNLSLEVGTATMLSLTVFDITGRQVAMLFDGRIQPGAHHFAWQPVSVASGVYFVRVNTPEFSRTQKIVFLK